MMGKKKANQKQQLPTPGAATNEQKNNPVFAQPTNGAETKKLKSKPKNNKSTKINYKAKKSGFFPLRSLLWYGLIIYLIYATFWRCPTFTTPILSPDAPTDCKALYRVTHDVLAPVFLPLYKQYLEPYVGDHVDAIRYHYTIYGHPVLMTAAKYAEVYGKPAFQQGQVYLQQGQEVYFQHAHPIVVELHGRVKEQYDVLAKEHVDRVVDHVSEHYEAYIGEYVDKTQEVAAKAYATAQEVHVRHVQPAIKKYGPVIQEKIELAKPVVKQGVDTATVYYKEYVDPTARKTAVVVKDVWDNQVVPTWNDKVLPEVKRIHRDHVGPKAREIYGRVFSFVTGNPFNETEIRIQSARREIENIVGREIDAIIEVGRRERAKLDVAIEGVHDSVIADIKDKVEPEGRQVQERATEQIKAIAEYVQRVLDDAKKKPHARIVDISKHANAAIKKVEKQTAEAQTVLRGVVERARDEIERVEKEAQSTVRERGLEAIRALRLAKPDIGEDLQPLYDEAKAMLDKVTTETRQAVAAAKERADEVRIAVTSRIEELVTGLDTWLSDASKEVHVIVEGAKAKLEEEGERIKLEEERIAREKEEKIARERAAKEKREREAKELAEKEAKEKAAREAKIKAEKEARETAEKEAREKAEQEATVKEEL
ncbi:hypothetical protein BC936DRAFT_144152 [Jimgerdemannia flammicorona]|uniref:Uncharacterized protein n=1 Tax=Jimgerdemannia flammicorona TaxID=994334 RepID=A0A433DD03_9FUNG|nr:hypothetical protein BC936DRAFT_144152 [Jimgerdemannia flammicorona]